MTERGSFGDGVLLPIFALVAANLILKLSTVQSPPLYLDEVASVWYAQQDWQSFVDVLSRDASPPLFALLLRAWIMIFGISELAVRFMSVLAASTIPASVFALTWRPWGRVSAWLAALMVSLAPVQLDFAQQARGYALAAAFAAFSVVCFHRLMREGSSQAAIGLIIADLCMLYTHYTCGLLIVARLAAIPAYGTRHLRRLFLAAAIVGLFFVPGLLRIDLNQVQEPMRWYHAPSLGTIGTQWVALCGNLGAGIMLAIAITAGVGLAFRGRHDRAAGDESVQLLILSVAWGLLTTALAFVVSQKIPVFELRYLVPAAAGIPVAAVWLVSALKGQRLRLVVALVLGGMALVSYRFTATVREDWRSAAEWVIAHRQPGDVVVVSAGYQCRSLVYALDRDLFEVIEHPHRVWFERERLVCVNVLESEVLDQLQPDSVILVQSHANAVDPDNRTGATMQGFGELDRSQGLTGIHLSRFVRVSAGADG